MRCAYSQCGHDRATLFSVLVFIGCVSTGWAASFGNPPQGESAASGQRSKQIWFERLPPASLPSFVHFNGHSRASLLTEDNGSGCAWGDYDGDGDDDGDGDFDEGDGDGDGDGDDDGDGELE